MCRCKQERIHEVAGRTYINLYNRRVMISIFAASWCTHLAFCAAHDPASPNLDLFTLNFLHQDQMDTFIQSTSDLLEAFPAATVLITYANAAKKSKKDDTKPASNVVKFKVYDAQLGKCIQYSTYKSKELSRLLTFLGPRGVSMKRKHDEEETAEKKPKLSLGVASVMGNVKIEDQEQQEGGESEAVGTPAPEEVPVASSSSKKKKKKGKKK